MSNFIVLAVAFISVASASRHSKPDYYWREYNGKAPKDALKVAQNGSDVPVYIGQGYFYGIGILPGMITDGRMELSVAAGGVFHTITDNIKIMATDSVRPEKDFYWIPMNFPNFHKLKKIDFLNLPSGGTESNSTLYIGRHSEPGYTNIGKIYSVEPWQGLTIADSRGNFTIYKNFEILITLQVDCDVIGENEKNSEKSNDSSASSGDFV